MQPVESFALPPAANTPKGVVSGTVIDVDTHAPAAGARVSFAGLDSGFPGNAGGTVDATGKYALPALPVGTYPYLVAGGAGYEPSIVSPFNLVAGAQTSNHQPRRGWALASGGGAITAFTGTDNSAFGCGPAALIDGKLGSGWGSDLTRRLADDHGQAAGQRQREDVRHRSRARPAAIRRRRDAGLPGRDLARRHHVHDRGAGVVRSSPTAAS